MCCSQLIVDLEGESQMLVDRAQKTVRRLVFTF